MRIFVTPSVLLQAAALAACLCPAEVCHAAPPQSESAKLRAQGDIAADSDNLHEAVELWLRAWTMSPGDHDLACNIGRVLFRVAKYPESSLWLTRCVHLLPDARTPAEVDRLIRATNELHSAREQVATLSFKAEPGTQIVIDAEIVRTTPLREDIFLAPGDHHIDAHKDGRSLSLDVTVAEGKEQSVSIEFPKAEQPTLPPVSLVPPFSPPQQPSALAVLPVFRITRPLMLRPGLTVLASEPDGVLPYFVTSPNYPSEPEPGPFRVWPLVAGGALTAGALATGVAFAIKSATTDDPHEEKVYDTVKYLSLGGTVLLLGATLGYAIYENRRTSITILGSRVSWSYIW